MRAEVIRATHRRNGRTCAGCTQTWPCTQIAWADDLPLPAGTLRWRRACGLAAVAAVPLTLMGVALLPTWALLVLFVGIPLLGLLLLIAASGRRL